MKKILVLFGIIAITPMCSFAYLDEYETANINTLEAQGYSQSMLQAVDWANYRNRGVHGKYVRHYQQKNSNALGRAYQRLKVYFDPIQDDGTFGDDYIQFSNTWMSNDTKYSSDVEKNPQVERL